MSAHLVSLVDVLAVLDELADRFDPAVLAKGDISALATDALHALPFRIDDTVPSTVDVLALKAQTKHFDSFVGACMDANGIPIAPSRRELAQARACLPPLAKHSFNSKVDDQEVNAVPVARLQILPTRGMNIMQIDVLAAASELPHGDYLLVVQNVTQM